MHALLGGLGQDLVVDVGDVADEVDVVAAGGQPAAQHVEVDRRAHVADVRLGLHGETADVDPRPALDEGDEVAHLARRGVVEPQSHRPSLGRTGRSPDFVATAADGSAIRVTPVTRGSGRVIVVACSDVPPPSPFPSSSPGPRLRAGPARGCHGPGRAAQARDPPGPADLVEQLRRAQVRQASRPEDGPRRRSRIAGAEAAHGRRSRLRGRAPGPRRGSARLRRHRAHPVLGGHDARPEPGRGRGARTRRRAGAPAPGTPSPTGHRANRPVAAPHLLRAGRRPRLRSTSTPGSRAGGVTSWQVRVTLLRPRGSSLARRPRARSGRSPPSTPPRPVRPRSPDPRPAPSSPCRRYSQMVHEGHYPQWGGGGEAWCSPTSTAMVLGYYGISPRARRDRGRPRRPVVDHAAKMVYDHGYDGTGNWAFNTAYAATLVAGDSYVTRLRDLREAEDHVAAGVPARHLDRLRPRRAHRGPDLGEQRPPARGRRLRGRR